MEENRRITNQLLCCYELQLLEQEKSKLTVKKYMRDLKFFSDFAKEKSVTKELIISYKQYLVEASRSILPALIASSTSVSMRAAISSFSFFS